MNVNFNETQANSSAALTLLVWCFVLGPRARHLLLLSVKNLKPLYFKFRVILFKKLDSSNTIWNYSFPVLSVHGFQKKVDISDRRPFSHSCGNLFRVEPLALSQCINSEQTHFFLCRSGCLTQLNSGYLHNPIQGAHWALLSLTQLN